MSVRCSTLMILFQMPIVLLFTEPRVSKVCAKRLPACWRSSRSCGNVSSLLVGMEAMTQPPSWLMQQP